MSEKYPRTSHVPWSPGCTRDDKMLADVAPFLGVELVITEKADGSNVCLERDAVFARSHSDAPRHASFDALKALHAATRWHVPETWQVFGEWLWARHSITYDRLPAHLLVFGVRDLAAARWLSWADTEAWCAGAGLETVPVLWTGIANTEAELRRLSETLSARCIMGAEQEGVVIRRASDFADADFAASVAKWVRPAHVRTDAHWTEQQIIRNILRPAAPHKDAP